MPPFTAPVSMLTASLSDGTAEAADSPFIVLRIIAASSVLLKTHVCRPRPNFLPATAVRPRLNFLLSGGLRERVQTPKCAHVVLMFQTFHSFVLVKSPAPF